MSAGMVIVALILLLIVATAVAACCMIWANDAEHAAQQAERENVAMRKRLGVIADA